MQKVKLVRGKQGWELNGHAELSLGVLEESDFKGLIAGLFFFLKKQTVPIKLHKLRNDVVKAVFSLYRGTIQLSWFCLIAPTPVQWQAFTACSPFGLV